MTEPDEKIEETETGYSLTIKSKRGTGTRNSDEVRVTAKTETLDELREEAPALHGLATTVLNNRREHQPDGEVPE